MDSIFSHLAWVNAIEEKQGVAIPFPIIADLDLKVSHAYGMIHPGEGGDTAAVRAVFVIDPKRVIRAVIYYPMNAGRNIDEILRLVDALQTSDANGVSCPANWRPGEDVVVGAPALPRRWPSARRTEAQPQGLVPGDQVAVARSGGGAAGDVDMDRHPTDPAAPPSASTARRPIKHHRHPSTSRPAPRMQTPRSRRRGCADRRPRIGGMGSGGAMRASPPSPLRAFGRLFPVARSRVAGGHAGAGDAHRLCRSAQPRGAYADRARRAGAPGGNRGATARTRPLRTPAHPPRGDSVLRRRLAEKLAAGADHSVYDFDDALMWTEELASNRRVGPSRLARGLWSKAAACRRTVAAVDTVIAGNEVLSRSGPLSTTRASR